MNKIPRHITERDKEGVEQITYYGVPATELDRDGLLAALNVSERKARMGFENFKQYREFQAEVRAREQADHCLSGGLIGRR